MEGKKQHIGKQSQKFDGRDCSIYLKVSPTRSLRWNVMNIQMCHGQKSRFFGDGHPTFNRNPYNGYINPYYWVDDHPLLYGNNGSLDPGTNEYSAKKALRLPQFHQWNAISRFVGCSWTHLAWSCMGVSWIPTQHVCTLVGDAALYRIYVHLLTVYAVCTWARNRCACVDDGTDARIIYCTIIDASG